MNPLPRHLLPVPSDRWWRWSAVTILVGSLGFCLLTACRLTDEHLQEAKLVHGLLTRDQALLRQFVPTEAQLAGREPRWIALAAEAAAQQLDAERATNLYRRLPRDGGRLEWLACRGLARRAMARGELTQAEQFLRRGLELTPQDIELLSRLGHLLQYEGRTWEAVPLFQRLIRLGTCRGDELLGAASVELFFRDDEHLDDIAARSADPDPLSLLPVAREAMFRNDVIRAEAILRQVIQSRPDLSEAQGRLGRLLANRGADQEFSRWQAALPGVAQEHPEVWYAFGWQARRLGRFPQAVRCFLETLERSPQHLGAHLQLAGCLHQVDRPDDAQRFETRGKLLSELESRLNLGRADSSPEHLLILVDLLTRLDRPWEAAGWASLLKHVPMDRSAAEAQARETAARARRSPWPEDRERYPARHLNRTAFPLPTDLLTSPPSTISEPSVGRRASQDDSKPSVVPWNFREQAAAVGLEFRYFEGTDEAHRLEHIFHTLGGGVAAFDYDQDGWPDLYFAQGNSWRNPATGPPTIDRLFRNRTGKTFLDVTIAAQLGDAEFTHGVSVGDYDQDGFPDLFLGNLGPNRFYRNLGDGTFQETAEAAGVANDEWSTSSVLADLNQDGLPDLYVLNYAERDEAARKECGTPEKRMACTPGLLTPIEHRCYLNLGDGRFRDLSKHCGINDQRGNGLGVIAWDFQQNGRLGLYVANDTTPDFFFVPQPLSNDGEPRFLNEAVLRGIAYDANGNPQASMGVAAGDVTGDGLIDLAVTDFFASANSLFSLNSSGYFDDLSLSFGVHEPSLPMLGFGCQFADFDGDGWLDLIIANGHVDQQTASGGPDRMPPQLLRNEAGRRFVEIPGATLGEFFHRPSLGRSLATLDWNRDGRTDFVVSYLHDPVALVTNETLPTTTPLTIRLMGRKGCREPIGSSVRLLDIEPQQIRLQTAGDGYLCVNERRHQFAIPRGRTSVDVLVRWPDGALQRFDKLAPGTELLLIEGRPDAIRLHKDNLTE